ncbi:caspase family protein [Desulfobacterales bacterium HSG16]|nr:caspase family protein [Desulfobacterales bacterium HSG16]
MNKNLSKALMIISGRVKNHLPSMMLIIITLGICEGALWADVASVDTPKIFVQYGHSGNIMSVVISPDGRYALSGSGDKTLKFWDIKTGREIRTFKGHTEVVRSVAVSPNGKYALSGSGDKYRRGRNTDKTLKLWNIKTGREIRTFKGHTEVVSSVVFSPDGKCALSGSWDETLKLWNISTGREIRTFKHDMEVNSVAISPDGRYALSGSGEHYICTSSSEFLKLWDISTGREIRTFHGHKDDVTSIAISPDGKYALSGSQDETLKLWNIETGSEIRTFRGHEDTVSSVAFSSDGRYALSGSRDSTLKLWNIETGDEIRTFRGYNDTVYSVAFSPEGKYVLASLGNGLKLWNIETGKELILKKPDMINSVSISQDGKRVLSKNQYGGIDFWDIKTGRKVKTFKGDKHDFVPIAISPNGRYTVSRSRGGTLKLWEIATGKEMRTFKGYTHHIHSVAFSPDGRYVLSNGDYGTLKRWDIETGKVRTFKGRYGIDSIVFLPNGKHALSGDTYGLTLWNFKFNNGAIKKFNGHNGRVISVAISPNGRYAVSGSTDNSIKLWDMELKGRIWPQRDSDNERTWALPYKYKNGRAIKTFKGHTDDVNSVAISPNGWYILSGSKDHTLKLWDIKTNREIRTFKGHTLSVSSVIFSSDGRYALSGSLDGTIRVWDISTGKEIVQMVAFPSGEWIAFTSDGYYSASAKGDKHVKIRIDSITVEWLEKYRSTLFRPDMVQLALKGGKPEPPSITIAQKNKHKPGQKKTIAKNEPTKPPITIVKKASPKVWFTSPSENHKTELSHIEVEVKVENVSNQPDALAFFINDTPLSKEKRAVRPMLPGQTVKTLTINAPLIIGYNRIEVRAKDKYGKTHKFPPRTVIRKGKPLPALYYFGVGVSKHSNSINSLRYPAKDVTELSKVLKAQKNKAWSAVKTKILTNEQATREAIITEMNRFISGARTDDLIILFLSGHGKNEQSDYYFIAHDSDPDNAFANGLSWITIINLLRRNPVKVLLLADTCYSGNVIGTDLIPKSKNLIVMSSSSSDRVSREDASWGHGAFTLALIEGFSEKAFNKDGELKLYNLYEYVAKRVGKLTDGTQTPKIPDWSNFEKFNTIILGKNP